MSNVLTVNYNKGQISCPTAFVFSCPGEREIASGLLVNGQTGNNLDILINILMQQNETAAFFPFCNRYDYRITNSSNIVHYKNLDGKTEPSRSEIIQQANIQRLIKETLGFRLIIGFGDKAGIALNYIKQVNDQSIIIPVSKHLGFMSINRIKHDIYGVPIQHAQNAEEGKNNTKKRITVIATELTQKIINATLIC